MSYSQLAFNEQMKNAVRHISTPLNAERLLEIREALKTRLKAHPYTEEVADHERSIRWKRTAAEIFDDGYYYDDQDSADLTIVFLSLCRALGCTRTRFIRVRDGSTFHSIVEVQLNDGWYIFDVAAPDSRPVQDEISPVRPYGRWRLVRKGRDPWDVGLDRMNEM